MNGSLRKHFKEDPAIVRIPVVSADGTPLMPCKPTKARRLLESGKAFWETGKDGRYHLRLRFDPKSPIMKPPEKAKRGIDLNSLFLAELRDLAKRRDVWWKAVSKTDRDMINLAIRCVRRPKSLRLITALARIVVKLKDALISPLRRLMGQVGKPLALRLSRLAVRWGYKSAEKWAEDEGFIRYLTVMDKAFQTLTLNPKW
ncbi:RRXRR domain-containing protein [Candidatus Bathyarchaeota archaeon]|nr:RRXRR domain-containing protein [Candidatus Bathyarchaeota archaeon]